MKNALREAGRFYVEMGKLGAPLKYFDAGGGLGVDYDGSQTNFASSMNYTMQEYANDIVFALQEICDAGGVPHPTIVTESGRAVVAHHSMLVVDILGVGEFDVGKAPEQVANDAARVVQNLFETYREVSRKNVLEAYHDALEYKEEALQLFNLGNLSLSERVVAEDIFWAICQKLLQDRARPARGPRGAGGAREGAVATRTSATSRCSSRCPTSGPSTSCSPSCRSTASARSRPGARCWPTSPATPTARSITSSIAATSSPCSSCTRSNGQDYYLGIFLIGAYQEILGDLHNLFGNTNTVHVSLAAGGGYQIEHVVTGDTVTDVLKYVSYSREELVGPRAPLRRAGGPRQPHEPGRDPLDAAHVRRGPGRLHVPRARVARSFAPARSALASALTCVQSAEVCLGSRTSRRPRSTCQVDLQSRPEQ